MERVHFRLFTVDSVKAFESALQHLVTVREGGWQLTSVTEGFLGGLPAGQFALTKDERRETIPFSLDEASLLSFRQALQQLNNLPPQRQLIGEVRLSATDGARQVTIELLDAGKVRSVRRAPGRSDFACVQQFNRYLSRAIGCGKPHLANQLPLWRKIVELLQRLAEREK